MALQTLPSLCTQALVVFTSLVGSFDAKPIDEASGLALSPNGQSFYVANDSGDKPRFFRTALDGSKTEEFKVAAWKPFDVEDLSVGPCPTAAGKGSCLALADIGDNRARRKEIVIAFVRLDELEHKTDRTASGDKAVKIAHKLVLRYPDRPHNAEAFAILNSDYGLIATKEQNRKTREAEASQFYRVDFQKGKIEKVGSFDVPTCVKDTGFPGLVTGMSFAAGQPGVGSGNDRLLLLTYKDVIEMEFRLTEGKDSTKGGASGNPQLEVLSTRVLAVDPLAQQEAITYDEKRRGFYYTSEVPFSFLGGILSSPSAPIRYAEKP